MTSSDTVNTAVALQMTSSLDLIIEDVKMIMKLKLLLQNIYFNFSISAILSPVY